MELARHAASPDLLDEVLRTLREFAVGQELSHQLQGNLPTYEDWVEHADGHTGALHAFCCRAGAHLAHGDPAVVSALGRYGRRFGRVWNAAVDLAELEADSRGRHLLRRAMMGRPVLAVIRAAERDAGVGESWVRLSMPDEPEVQQRAADKLAAQVIQLGVPPVGEDMVREAWSAQRAIRALPQSPFRDEMANMAGRLARAS